MFHIILGAEFHAVDIKVGLQASEWVSKGGDRTVEQVDGHLVLVTGSNLHKSRGAFFAWRAPILSWLRIMCSQVRMLNFLERSREMP